MTKAELEKQAAELQAKIARQQERITMLEQRTATTEKVANIVRDHYAQYLIRSAVVQEWQLLPYMSQEDIEAQKRIMRDEHERYRGAMGTYCMLFEKGEAHNWHHERNQGDWRWSPWMNRGLVSDEAMAAKPEWAEAIERQRKAAAALCGKRKEEEQA